MKIKTLLYAMSVLILASCSNDEPAVGYDADHAAVVTAEIGEVSTRVTGTKWSPDDKIGISGTSGSVIYTNVPYVTDGTGSFNSFFGTAKGIFFQDENTARFSAYYPYNKEVTADNKVIIVDTRNQMESREFDFLFSSGALGSLSSTHLRFTGSAAFKHSMAQLIIHITPSSEDGFENSDVLNNGKLTLSGIIQDGEFNTSNGQAKATGNPEDVELNTSLAEISGRTTTYKCIFLPQSATEFVLNIEYQGHTYQCSFSHELQAGKSYTADFTLKRAGIFLGDVSISEWVADENGIHTGEIVFEESKEIEHNGYKGILMRKSSGTKGTDTYEPALYVATCNIGASTPEEVGKYFWWGDVIGYSAEESFYFGASNSEISTYNKTAEELQSLGIIDDNGNLTSAYDAAQQIMGGKWRMPAKEDFDWLMDEQNCTWTWDDKVSGYTVKSKQTNCEFFLKSGGRRVWSGVYDRSLVEYWLSTSNGTGAYLLFASYMEFEYFKDYTRNTGAPIRAIITH